MIRVERLDSGYYRIQGNGPCNWAQPPCWPCSEETLRASAFPECSEEFIREVLAEAEIERTHQAREGPEVA